MSRPAPFLCGTAHCEILGKWEPGVRREYPHSILERLSGQIIIFIPPEDLKGFKALDHGTAIHFACPHSNIVEEEAGNCTTYSRKVHVSTCRVEYGARCFQYEACEALEREGPPALDTSHRSETLIRDKFPTGGTVKGNALKGSAILERLRAAFALAPVV